MGIDEESYATLRPFLYHLTDKQNVERVRRTRKLQSAAILLGLAGQVDAVRNRRNESLPVFVQAERVILRDQTPLYENNTQLEGGWSFAEFVEHLNHHVFFWSGWERGPVAYGVRHFQRYCPEQPVIIRASFRSIRGENPDAEPLFCKYNSGSPRCSNGRRSPRGPQTFSTAQTADFTPGNVVEVVFRGSVILPTDREYKNSVTGQWRHL
jgi:hypothetical protein